MSLIAEVLGELWSMFVGDALLALAILVLIAVCAALILMGIVGGVTGGGLLLAGCLVILGVVTRRAAVRKARGG